MKTLLIIFTNNDSLENIKSPFSFPPNDDGNAVDWRFFKSSNVNILLINDGLCFDKQIKIVSDKILINNDNQVYIHLHESKQTKDLLEWRKEYPTANIVRGHHIKNGFYDEILPKVVSKELFEKDLEPFFNTKLDESLDLLHKILNREDIDVKNLSKELKSLFETHYNITEKYKDEYETQLVALRDAILEEKLANQH